MVQQGPTVTFDSTYLDVLKNVSMGCWNAMFSKEFQVHLNMLRFLYNFIIQE